jgi:hypothetical protein
MRSVADFLRLGAPCKGVIHPFSRPQSHDGSTGRLLDTDRKSMNLSLRLVCSGMLLLTIVGCGKDPATALPGASRLATTRSAAPASAVAGAIAHGFASLPDRGELIGYPRQPVKHDGAYTWHRTDLSEAHALNAIADGNLRVTTPSGETLVVRYDHHIEHASGDWTWVGHIPGQDGEQTILTFGAHAAFGSIAQPGKPPLRLTVRNGVSWLVETDPTKVAGIINAATRPQRPDYRIPPTSGVPDSTVSPSSAPSMASAPVMASATSGTAATVDLVLGYTPAFASDNGGQSGAITRLNYLVDVTNISYGNSSINARVRLVATVPVSYADNTSNDTTLDQLTGYDSSTNKTTSPNSAFNGLRAAREQYGADLVSMVRSFRDPENGGCGVGWLIGGSQQGISTSDSYYGYSVVSDGTDAGTDGHTYFCLDETLAHELGHNMGAQHDVDTAKGGDGVLNAGDYGAYAYSFGYKSATNAFYTVMAYGDSGQHIYRIFSDPRSTFCGGVACGSSQADNAMTLTKTIPVVATFRSTLVKLALHSDYDGDGRADILWRNGSSGSNRIWRSGNSSTPLAVSGVASQTWKIVGTGDFNGDGRADILWRDFGNGMNVAWFSGNSATQQAVTRVSDLAWAVVGLGDFDGDGHSDILWRNNSNGFDAIWRSGDSTTPQTITGVTNLAWKIVGVGDFDGDGRSDILWRNASNGLDVIWRSGDSSSQQPVQGVSNLAWAVVGVGDFDGDGRSDILWRNSSTGLNAIWKSGNASTPQSIDAVSSQDWKVVAVADYNADGQSDILWRNTANGMNTIWKSGNRSSQQAVTYEPDQAWTVVAG